MAGHRLQGIAGCALDMAVVGHQSSTGQACDAAPQFERCPMGSPFKDISDLGLLDDQVGDEALIDAMVANPILVNRPIVATPRGVALCRPSEAVLALLERKPASFTKEDGQVVTG